jgi:hypothetical protein
MAQFRANNTLLEYACSYWAYCVSECPLKFRDDALVLLANSLTCFTTLSWIETSFLLEPAGLWRLTIATEELDYWVDEHKGDTKVKSSLAAVDVWCTGVLEFLNSYGQLLAERPWIIWLTRVKQVPNHEDGARACSQYQLTKEEQEWVFDGSLVPANQEYKITPGARLEHSHWSLLKSRFGFIMYEPHRNIYITGESHIDEGERIFIQVATTGRRLPPAVATAFFGGYVMTAKISDNGKYLAIANSRWIPVWSIHSDIKFSKRLQNREWAVRLFFHKYYGESQKLNFDVIAFWKDNFLFTPGGWYESPSTEFHTFDFVQNQPAATSSTHFSGNGEFMLTAVTHDGRTRINKIATTAPQGDCSELLLIDAEPTWSFVASYAGRYLVLMRSGIEGRSRTYEAKLLDIGSRKTYDIASGLRHTGPRSFHFTRGDNELVTFLLGPRFEGPVMLI